MNFQTIKLPNSERFACSPRKLKAAFSDVANLGVYCGFLGKSFAVDSRSKIKGKSPLVELAQIDGAGEGVLPTLASLAQRYAKQRGLKKVEWVVHALNCAEPNLKLRRVMERRGFRIADVEGVGKAYYLVHEID